MHFHYQILSSYFYSKVVKYIFGLYLLYKLRAEDTDWK